MYFQYVPHYCSNIVHGTNDDDVGNDDGHQILLLLLMMMMVLPDCVNSIRLVQQAAVTVVFSLKRTAQRNPRRDLSEILLGKCYYYYYYYYYLHCCKIQVGEIKRRPMHGNQLRHSGFPAVPIVAALDAILA